MCWLLTFFEDNSCVNDLLILCWHRFVDQWKHRELRHHPGMSKMMQILVILMQILVNSYIRWCRFIIETLYIIR